MVKYIATRPIMEMCLAANNRPGPIVTIRWWEHEGLDFEGMRMAAQEAERIEGGE